MIYRNPNSFGYTGGNMIKNPLKKESRETLVKIIYRERSELRRVKEQREINKQRFKLAIRQLKKTRNNLNKIINTYERRDSKKD